jgi:hypothetical protein
VTSRYSSIHSVPQVSAAELENKSVHVQVGEPEAPVQSEQVDEHVPHTSSVPVKYLLPSAEIVFEAKFVKVMSLLRIVQSVKHSFSSFGFVPTVCSMASQVARQELELDGDPALTSMNSAPQVAIQSFPAELEKESVQAQTGLAAGPEQEEQLVEHLPHVEASTSYHWTLASLAIVKPILFQVMSPFILLQSVTQTLSPAVLTANLFGQLPAGLQSWL